MSRRSRAREVALQLLFQHDQNPKPVPRRAIEAFARDRLTDRELVSFCLTIYDGVLKHQPVIDDLLTKTAENWKLKRMLPADRNVLRIGTFELLHSSDVEPMAAILNESIELARRFGSSDSPSFVNGILDKVAKSKLPPALAKDAPLGMATDSTPTNESSGPAAE